MKKPDLRVLEVEIRTYRANRNQGARSVGGHLLLTNQRLLFYPHGLDGATGGKSWQCELRDIADETIAPRGVNPFNGSMRRRLGIAVGDSVDLFVVNKVADVAEAILRAARDTSVPHNDKG